ncbi:MAG TPA: hypothetical protein VF681_04240 [Abditibacteriaceae bacterium]|jgi:hypothetical protein
MNSKPISRFRTYALLLVSCLATWLSTEGTVKAQPPVSTQPAGKVIPFHANNWDSAFGVQHNVVGSYRVFPDRLEVHITTISLRLNKKLKLAVPRYLHNFYMGVAVPLDGARWKIARPSEAVALGFTLSQGDEAIRENIDFTIPLDGTISGSKSWLVCTAVESLSTDSSSKASVGYSHSHSNTNLLGEPRK